jgi:hypothetical protein
MTVMPAVAMAPKTVPPAAATANGKKETMQKEKGSNHRIAPFLY